MSRVRAHVIVCRRLRHGLTPAAVVAVSLISGAGRASAGDLDRRPPAGRRRLSGRGPASLARAAARRAALRSGVPLRRSEPRAGVRLRICADVRTPSPPTMVG